MDFNIKIKNLGIEIGFFKNNGDFLKLGLLAHLNSFFRNGFHISVSNDLGKVFHQKFIDFENIFPE